jgi:hypothetical protein
MSALSDIVLRGVVAPAIGAPADLAGLLNTAINKVAGTDLSENLPSGTDNLSKLLEDAGMVSPTHRPIMELLAGLVPTPGAGVHAAGAGIIAGETAIKKLDLGNLWGEVKDIYEKVKDKGGTERQAQFAASTHSENVLTRMGNPGEARSMFISKYGEPQLVIDDSKGVINTNNYESDYKSYSTIPKEITTLQDLYSHPSLFDISDLAKETKIVTSKELELGSAAFDPGSNRIFLPDSMHRVERMGVAGSKYNEDLKSYGMKSVQEILDAMLRHEVTHVLQKEDNLVSNGTGVSSASLEHTSQSIIDRLGVKDNTLNAAEVLRYSKDNKLPPELELLLGTDPVLAAMYKNNYGERAAEAGANYAPTSRPGVIFDMSKLW